MTDVICIGAQNSLDTVKDRLSQELDFLAADGIKVNIEPKRSRFFNFLYCQLDYDDAAYTLSERRHLSRQCIANALTDALVEDWQQTTLLRVLSRRFQCFTETEKQKIVQLATAKLAQRDAGPNRRLYQVARKSRIRESLSAYLNDQSRINLDGFLNFRLRHYWEELEDVLYLSIDQYLNEKEYQEFIQLLQHFVGIIEPRHELVHVVLTGADGFVLLDEQGHVLQADLLTNEFKAQSSYSDQDDLLLSALLSAAPKQLVLHVGTFRDRPKLVDTLKQIFSSRVVLCLSCDYCLRQLASVQKED